jgi:DNA/RNA-binding domain of Phe-tRNA-synthetase-like protein
VNGWAPSEGVVAPEVRDEFPGLRLQYVTVAQRRRPTPPALAARLRDLSNRYRGADVVTMRTKPIPHAFRAFFRQIGLDPDVRRIPSEEAAVSRLLHGEFRTVDLISDACLIALIETGVPVWALDADVVDHAGLGIAIAGGALVIADGSTVHAELFADPPAGHGVGSRTRRVTLFAVAVDGVPAIHLDEALWCALESLGAAP